MSKATSKNQVRVFHFRVECVDWQGHPFRYGSMARLYSVTFQREKQIGDSGVFLGTFSSPESLIEEGDWGSVLSTVTSRVNGENLKASFESWEPLYLVTDGGFSERIVRELRSLLCAPRLSVMARG